MPCTASRWRRGSWRHGSSWWDAIDEAAHDFHTHHGFRAIPGTMRLIQKVGDISAALGLG
jgi:hypothetical protein